MVGTDATEQDGAISIVAFPAPFKDNPYEILLYTQLWAHGIELQLDARFTLDWLRRHRGSPTILHFHWPQWIYKGGFETAPRRSQVAHRLVRFGSCLAAARLLGYRVVWTVHEVVPHDRVGFADHVASRMLALASQLLIVHDAPTARRARVLPGAGRKLATVYHPTWDDAYQRARPGLVVRRELGLSWARFVFLFFSKLRARKDVPLLIEAFAQTRRELPDVALVIAGQPDDRPSAEAVERAAEGDPRIKPLLRFIQAHEVADLFAAADAMVYPRRDGGTSGVIMLSLSMGTPAIVARLPVYVELVGDDVAGWLFEPGDRESLREVMIRAADPGLAAVRGLHGLERVADRDWRTAGRRTAELMHGLFG